MFLGNKNINSSFISYLTDISIYVISALSSNPEETQVMKGTFEVICPIILLMTKNRVIGIYNYLEW